MVAGATKTSKVNIMLLLHDDAKMHFFVKNTPIAKKKKYCGLFCEFRALLELHRAFRVIMDHPALILNRPVNNFIAQAIMKERLYSLF